MSAPATTWALDSASANGDTATVLYLCSNRPEGGSQRAYDLAAVKGHLEVLQILCWFYGFRGTVWAVHGAAMNGHLPVLRWLTETYTNMHPANGITTHAVDLAALHGHLHCVAYLSEKDISGWTEWGLMSARVSNLHEMLQHTL